MEVADSPSALKQFRRTPWKFQRTFQTPIKDLQRFATTIMSMNQLLNARITIESAIFEPKHWIELLSRYSLPHRYARGTSVTATGQQD